MEYATFSSLLMFFSDCFVFVLCCLFSLVGGVGFWCFAGFSHSSSSTSPSPGVLAVGQMGSIGCFRVRDVKHAHYSLVLYCLPIFICLCMELTWKNIYTNIQRKILRLENWLRLEESTSVNNNKNH